MPESAVKGLIFTHFFTLLSQVAQKGNKREEPDVELLFVHCFFSFHARSLWHKLLPSTTKEVKSQGPSTDLGNPVC